MTSIPKNAQTATRQDLFALDLCVLAYHVYNQSLVWPLDPFYEEWARPGSSRRNNLMELTHGFVDGDSTLRGPGTTRGWPSNPQLDPIISDYRDVQPWHGSVLSDGLAVRYLSAHPTVMGTIADLKVAEYTGNLQGRPTNPAFLTHKKNPRAQSGANDHLYSFEGATGAFDGKPPAWSLMGIILERERSGEGGYDVHIAFRGSQSGSAYRAAYQGFVLEAGNPDWVTDMEFLKNVNDARVATVGEVVVGLRDSVLASFGTITHCLDDIATRRGSPPKHVHVTGHSLGGGLATQLAAALSIGKLRNALPANLQNWPLDSLKLTTMSAPKAGDSSFAEQLGAAIDVRRVWAAGDPIVSFPFNEHVGIPVELTTGLSGTENHEPVIVREAIVAQLRAGSTAAEAAYAHEPWRYFDDLGSALLAAELDGDELDNVFTSSKVERLNAAIELAAQVIERKSSYKVPITKLNSELRTRVQRLRSVFDYSASSVDDIASRLEDLSGVQPGSTVEDHLRRLFVVREAARNAWTATDLLANEHIARTLGTDQRPLR